MNRAALSIACLTLAAFGIASVQLGRVIELQGCRDLQDHVLAVGSHTLAVSLTVNDLSRDLIFFAEHSCVPCPDCHGSGHRKFEPGKDGTILPGGGLAVFPEADLRCACCMGRGWTTIPEIRIRRSR